MRILLVDDHGLFLEGLQNLLAAGGYQVVGAVRDGMAGVELARKLHPDVILMDIRLPRCDGITATRLIHAEQPTVKIVMLTTSDDDADLFAAIKSGASGYLLKSLEPNQLFEHLAALEQGQAPLSRELATRLLHEFARHAPALDECQWAAPHAANRAAASTDLTQRQREILALVAEGLTYKEIGARLSLSENTIKYHTGEILRRLHLKNREQIVAYALRLSHPASD